jgi:hypothetical protein
MSHVIFSTETADLDFVADALRHDLGKGYTVVTCNGAHPALRVSSSSMSYANVRLHRRDDGTHVNVHGGGFLIGRAINECTIARKVAAALRRCARARPVDTDPREVQSLSDGQ